MGERVQLTLGPERRRPLPGCPGFYVRIDDDLRKCVVFLGFAAGAEKGGIDCIGTGFLLSYDGFGYLITARHLAERVGGDPFLLRLNKRDGTSENAHVDGAEWAFHPHSDVDIAVVPFNIPAASPYDLLYLPYELVLDADGLARRPIGIGDLTYTIGLFKLLHGKRQNLPVLHFGVISLMPQDFETIPIKNWRDNGPDILQVQGYLVEAQSLRGLSGSPVFVRPTRVVSTAPPGSIPTGPTFEAAIGAMSEMQALAPNQRVFLLGLWQGAWDAPPDEILAAQSGKEDRVPVGMGIVLPAQRIKETLDIDGLRTMREKAKAKRNLQTAATPDSAVSSQVSSVSAQAGDANPNHLKDFTRLVDVAARKRPQGD